MNRSDAGPSFEATALPHLDAAYNLAHWLMHERAAAEDVVQEAMLRALTYFPGFRGDNARAWLLQIVRNVAYTSLQKQQGMKMVSLSDDETDSDTIGQLYAAGDTPESAWIKDAERRQLHSLLATLPVELRECLVLKELEDLSYKEIADITDVPIGTVMSRLWRARQVLMKTAKQVHIP